MNIKTKISQKAVERGVIHKDCEPTETIKCIRDRLARLGLSITEPVNFENPFSNCWSCDLRDCNYPLLKAYGKGISREYALASAYAEYIERLQCFAQKNFRCRNIDQSGRDIHPDSLYLDKYELAKRCPGLFCGLCLDDIPANKLLCIPFAVPFECKVEPLPYDLMFSGTGSTGMCAGNSPDEAIGQGICEIMERYALRMIAEKNIPSFPTVPLNSLSIKDTLTLGIINELKNKGLEIILKDCTFNGRIPVISVIIIDKKNDLCGVAFGSDPVFESALQRCLTEIYQNHKDLVFSYSNVIKNNRLGRDLVNHPERLMKYLLDGYIINGSNIARTFAPIGKSNSYYLKYLLNILRLNGKTIYIRDFSFLEFPSFYVFIPGMSRFPPAPGELAFGIRDADLILGILSQMGDEIPNETIRNMADIFFYYLKSDDPFLAEMPRVMERLLMGTPVLVWVDPMVFIAFVFIEVGDFKSAMEVLGISENPFSDIVEIKSILKKYCKLLIQKKNKKDILQQLKRDYQGSLYYDTLGYLVDGYFSSFYNKAKENQPPKKFDGLPLPLCANKSGCSSCLCRPYCYINKFNDIRCRLSDEYVACDQQKVNTFFS